jgi:hypothetical protein
VTNNRVNVRITYSACVVLYCHLWSVGFYNTFLHYFTNGTIFEKNCLTKKIVFYFLCKLLWNTSYSKNNSARYCNKRKSVIMQSTRYSCHILIKFEFSRQILENPQKRNFTKICPVGTKLFHEDRRRTDRHDEADNRFSQICERF